MARVEFIRHGPNSRNAQILKEDLGTKLHRSRITHRRDSTEARERNVSVQTAEVNIIEDVKALGSQLDPEGLAETKVLYRRQVKSHR